MANKTLLVIFLFVLELMDIAVSAKKVKSKYCSLILTASIATTRTKTKSRDLSLGFIPKDKLDLVTTGL